MGKVPRRKMCLPINPPASSPPLRPRRRCPLFRVRNKEKAIYCKPEITRFKGLGEISPKEFAQFIGKEMRLSKVEYAPKPEHVPLLNFYMGKNTPERKDYIMERLVVPVEE